MAEELFWETLKTLTDEYPEFLTKSRRYPGLPHRFTRMVYAVDSTTIPLVANCMEWAKHRRQKTAAKLHMNLDMQSFLPSFAIVREAKHSDPKVAWEVCANLRLKYLRCFLNAWRASGIVPIPNWARSLRLSQRTQTGIYN